MIALRMDHLNEKQRQAVSHKEGPLLVVAGAGTGKTRVITERIAHILKEGWCNNDEILALTFTEKATAEIEERVDTLMPLGYEAIAIRTFHGFCDSILRDYAIDIGISPAFHILSGVDQWQFMRDNLYEFELDYYRPLNNPTKFIDALVGYFSKLKEELNSPEDALNFAKELEKAAKEEEDKLEAQRQMELAKAYGKYQELMLKNNFLDFADLQFKTIELFNKRPNILKFLQNKFKYVLVDEYQDTNIAQNKIVDMLAGGHKNIMVVGDDDQSIYKFRGAAISNILQFQENYPEASVVVLTENYRSTQKILDFAYEVIQNNNPDRLEVKAGIDKKIKGQSEGDAESIHLVHSSTIEQEIDYVLDEIKASEKALSDIAILVRANAHAQPYIEAFKRRNIPYTFVSERGLYQKKEISDLIAVLRVLSNPKDDISFYAVLRMPIWKLSMESIAMVIREAKTKYMSVWKAIQNKDEFKHLYETLYHVLEYSKEHSVGETLYEFVSKLELYEELLKEDNLEAEDQVINIASFFTKIREFERGNEQKSVIDFVNYLDLAEEAGDNPNVQFDQGREGIFISSVHGSKGLEFDTVFVAGVTSDRFPPRRQKDPIEIPDKLVHEILNDKDSHVEEERRLFYVAITRAKNKLHLLYSDFYNYSSAKNPRKKKLSPFVAEVLEKVELTQVEKTVEGAEKFLKPKAIEKPTEEMKREKINHFSYSQLSSFENCPRQYEYAYVFNIPTPPGANLSFGSTMHNTLQAFYKLVMQNKQASLFEEFSPDVSLENLLKIYEEKWLSDGYDSKEHMELRKERGREILSQFYGHFEKEMADVKFLEKGFKLKVGPYTIGGRIDRADQKEDGTLEIIDYKTGKSRSQKEVDSNLQLMIYAMAAKECFGQAASLLTLYFLDDDTKLSTDPDEEKLEEAKAKIVELGDKINESNFAPKPDKFKCKYCPFNKICDAAIL